MKIETKCNNCGDKFKFNPKRKSGRFCSHNCQTEMQKKDIDEMKDDILTDFCSNCDKKFTHTSIEPGIFCSNRCVDKKLEDMNYNKSKVCNNCNNKFICKRSKTGDYCSHTCQVLDQRCDNKNTCLRSNANYKKYKDDFNKCEVCDKSTKLEVHHIVPVRMDKTLIDDETNLIAICKRCHDSVDEHRTTKNDIGSKERDWRIEEYKEYTKNQRAKLMNKTDDLSIIKYIM